MKNFLLRSTLFLRSINDQYIQPILMNSVIHKYRQILAGILALLIVGTSSIVMFLGSSMPANQETKVVEIEPIAKTNNHQRTHFIARTRPIIARTRPKNVTVRNPLKGHRMRASSTFKKRSIRVERPSRIVQRPHRMRLIRISQPRILSRTNPNFRRPMMTSPVFIRSVRGPRLRYVSLL